MISVLVVSHNTRQHLEHCLGTLTDQGGYGEILVVDNASTDGSPDLVRERFPEVRLLALDENLGFGAANNRAAAEARGDALLLLNSDAWLAGGALGTLRSALDADPSLGAVAPRLFFPDGRPQFHWAPPTGVWGEALQKLRNPFESRPWVHRPPPVGLHRLLGRPWYTAACLLVRRDAFEAVGGFDEAFFLYFEDVDLCLRLLDAGFRLASVDAATAFHVKGASRPSARGEIEYRRSQLRFYRKHRPAWENTFLRAKLRRKFRRLEDPDLRRRLSSLLALW